MDLKEFRIEDLPTEKTILKFAQSAIKPIFTKHKFDVGIEWVQKTLNDPDCVCVYVT